MRAPQPPTSVNVDAADRVLADIHSTLAASKVFAAARAAMQRTRAEVERTVLARVKDWQGVLASAPNVADGRGLLRQMLPGPLTLTPERRTYRFKGEVATGALIAGAAGISDGISPVGTSPTGSDPFHVVGSILRRRAA